MSRGLLSWVVDLAYSPENRTHVALVVGIIGLVAYIVFFSARNRYKLPPGPRPWPILGNLRDLAPDTNFYILLTNWREKYGDVFLLHLGQRPTVVLNSVSAVKEALITKGNVFAGRPVLLSASLLSEGNRNIAFGQFGSAWKLQRKIAHGAIRKYASGKHLEHLMQSSMNYLSEMLKKDAGQPVEIREMTSLLVYNVFCSMCFGQQYSPNDKRFQGLTEVVDKVNVEFGDGLLADCFPVLEYFPSRKATELKKLYGVFSNFLYGTLREHERTFDPDNLTDFTYELLNKQREAELEGDPVLQQLTETHFAQTLSDIFVAGTDTTRYTLAWFLQFVALYPEIQRKIQKEIDDVVGPDAKIGLETRKELNYTQAVLHEVMRMRPIAPLAVQHATLKDTSVAGYDIPKGYMVIVNLWSLHYDPEEWEQPGEFTPERFLDQDGTLAPQPEGWMPFSCGRRVCVGEALAKAELPVLAAMMLQKYTFRPPPEVTLTLESEPTGGMVVPKAFDLLVEPRL